MIVGIKWDCNVKLDITSKNHQQNPFAKGMKGHQFFWVWFHCIGDDKHFIL